MKKRNNYFAYALIIIGLYFFITQFDHPLIRTLNSWPVILIGFGIWMVFRYTKMKNPQLLPEGLLILFVGIHFYGLLHLAHWPNDWTVFLFIAGLALILSYMHTKKHLLLSITLIVLSLLLFFTDLLPAWVPSVTTIQTEVAEHWPLLLIICGILVFFNNKK